MMSNQQDNATGRTFLRDEAYERLKEMILNGAMPAGTFLSERKLAAQLTMSKTPIRVALERLNQEGFVAISPQQGIVVRELSLREIIDHYDIRIALETFVVRHLAGRLSPQQVEQLQSNLAAQQAAVEAVNFTEFIKLDADFHLMLCEFLGNLEILRVMRRQRDKLYGVLLHILERNLDWMNNTREEHVGIVEALVAEESELASTRMKMHLERGRQFLVPQAES